MLDDLERRQYLSDERFAEGYVRERSRKRLWPLRIRAELSERGIAADSVHAGWMTALSDWARCSRRQPAASSVPNLLWICAIWPGAGGFFEQRGFRSAWCDATSAGSAGSSPDRSPVPRMPTHAALTASVVSPVYPGTAFKAPGTAATPVIAQIQ